jgi:Tfp pilus assembly protein PilO
MTEDWRDLYADDDFDHALSQELEDTVAQIEYLREQLASLEQRKRHLEAQMPKDAVAEALEVAAAAWAKEDDDDRYGSSESTP